MKHLKLYDNWLTKKYQRKKVYSSTDIFTEKCAQEPFFKNNENYKKWHGTEIQ